MAAAVNSWRCVKVSCGEVPGMSRNGATEPAEGFGSSALAYSRGAFYLAVGWECVVGRTEMKDADRGKKGFQRLVDRLGRTVGQTSAHLIEATR
jgi:hypothetical protein